MSRYDGSHRISLNFFLRPRRACGRCASSINARRMVQPTRHRPAPPGSRGTRPAHRASRAARIRTYARIGSCPARHTPAAAPASGIRSWHRDDATARHVAQDRLRETVPRRLAGCRTDDRGRRARESLAAEAQHAAASRARARATSWARRPGRRRCAARRAARRAGGSSSGSSCRAARTPSSCAAPARRAPEAAMRARLRACSRRRRSAAPVARPRRTATCARAVEDVVGRVVDEQRADALRLLGEDAAARRALTANARVALASRRDRPRCTRAALTTIVGLHVAHDARRSHPASREVERRAIGARRRRRARRSSARELARRAGRSRR